MSMKMTKVVGGVAAVLCSLFFSTPGHAQINERTFRFATNNPAGHPIPVGAEKWAEIVKEKSGGKMTIKVFPGAVLGGDVQVLSSVQGGTIDFMSMNSGILQSQVKEFAVLDFPFLFNDGKEADKILDGVIGKQLADLLPPKGLINLAYFELGFRQLTNNRRPINRMEDISGLKIRVIQSPIYIDTFNALGANALPMPFPEVYTSLEQKIIDGQENPTSVVESNKLFEVQKHLTITNHIYNPQSLLSSKKTWDKLTKDEQNLLQSAAIEATKFQRQFARDTADKSFDALKKTMQVTVLSPEEITKIRDKLKPVIEKYSVSAGPELVKQLLSELEKMRK